MSGQYNGITSNAIYVFIISDCAQLGVSEAPVVDWQSRFRFMDA